jgi:hypothetical protein
MSAAGRGPRLGGKEDVYETPGWCVERLLEVWQPRPGLLIEPCAGSGKIIMAAQNILDHKEYGWQAYELRSECAHSLSQLVPCHCPFDFLKIRLYDDNSSAVITNPPYSLAEAFIRTSRECHPNADVAMLLRLGFLGSEKRAPLYREIGAPDLFTFSNRPSYIGSGNDSSDYAWFIWPPKPRLCGFVHILDLTPDYVRNPNSNRNRKVTS